MTRIKELIRKLWEGKLTANESMELDDLINHKDGEFREDLEKQFYSALASKEQQQEKSRPAKVYSIRRYSWQVAASLLIGFLLLELLLPNDTVPKEQRLVTAGTVTSKPAPELIHMRNRTAIDMNIRLSDGSEVILSPGSSISYKKLFDSSKRDVSLTGKAYFKVEKNPAKPFSVLTGDFATTALGTEFEVNTFGLHKLVVRLFTGKVKVHAPDYAGSFNAVYLAPGQEVSINVNNRSVDVRGEFKPEVRQLAKKVTPASKTVDLNFENEPLVNVFNKLSVVYNISIEYNMSQIDGLYFTGAVLQTDSINNIITLIANMNGFVALHVDNHFVIQKK